MHYQLSDTVKVTHRWQEQQTFALGLREVPFSMWSFVLAASQFLGPVCRSADLLLYDCVRISSSEFIQS